MCDAVIMLTDVADGGASETPQLTHDMELGEHCYHILDLAPRYNLQ